MSNIADRSTTCKHQHRSSYTRADGSNSSSKYQTVTPVVLEYVTSAGATASTTVPPQGTTGSGHSREQQQQVDATASSRWGKQQQ